MLIQTPGLDEGNAKYKKNDDLWASVRVPSGHKAMVSFTFLHVVGNPRFRCNNAVELYKGGTDSEDRLWRTCGYSPSVMEAVESDVYHVHFSTSQLNFDRFEGFRLHFSFHKVVCLIDLPVCNY